MLRSKELVQQAGIVPDIRLFVKKEGGGTISTGAHKVKMLSDKVIKSTDYETGKEIAAVEYILEENGEKKRYEVPVKDKKDRLHYLVQHLSEIEPNEEIILTGKRKGAKAYVEVSRITSTQEVEDDTDQFRREIEAEKPPVIDLDEVESANNRIDPKEIPF